MTKITMSREEWEALEDWKAKLVNNRQAFQTNFMTVKELSRVLSGVELPRTNKPEREAPAWTDESKKSLLDEMEAWQETQRQELVAFAEKLGCNLYLAAYLKHLDEKLDAIADVFGNNRVKMQEPVN